MPVLTGPPLVTLRQAAARPYDAAVAAARTCYAPRVVAADEVTPGQRESIGPLTFEAGHHTVWQHAHFEFGLENVSRQMVWSFLHSHPFYNSEQSSQRFVRLDEIRAHVPAGLSDEARGVYESAVESAWGAYRTLTTLLREDTLRILSELRHLTPQASEKRQKKVQREAEKKAIETARYVIPVAAFTSLVHTVSGIVLHRLHRMMLTGDTPAESRAVVEAMVALVKAAGSRLLRAHRARARSRRTGSSRPGCRGWRLTATPRRRASTRCSARARRCSSTSWHAPSRRPPRRCAPFSASGRTRSATTQALERLLDPAQNRYRLETLQLSVHSPLARAMHHASYTFLKRLSHTADSQDQRHRMVPASRPLLTLTDTRRPDFVTAAPDRGEPARARGLRRGDGARLGGQEPPARAGRAAREGALPAAERQGAALPRDAGACSTSRTSG